jgi:aminopeptidase N
MNNFYTVTVYNKGAEVIRMMHALLGVANFRKGMDLYFERHDGTAVTCDDFVGAMEDASGVSLKQFRRWYSQAGTPVLSIVTVYDDTKQTYTVTVNQQNGEGKLPLHIPLDIELLGSDGQSLPLIVDGESISSVLDVLAVDNTFVFENISQAPTPVLLKNFSAPVKVNYEYQDSELLHLIKYASDDFSRWDSAQKFYLNKVNQYIADAQTFSLGDEFVAVCESLLADQTLDKAMVAQILKVPSFESIASDFECVDVDGINNALSAMTQELSNKLYQSLLTCFKANVSIKFSTSQQAVAQRALKNVCLNLLAYQDKTVVNDILALQFDRSDNMTDTLAVLAACNNGNHKYFIDYMAAFEPKWIDDPLVMDKWFGLHASCTKSDVFETIEKLYEHKVFNIENPNRVRAVLGAFVFGNSVQFHEVNGRGYRLLTDMLVKLNSINPQVASRMVTPFMSFKRYDSKRQQLMREQLERLAALPDLSPDLFEKVTQSLQ